MPPKLPRLVTRDLLGYAWAALGKHTPKLLRDWESAHPDRELRLVRHNSPTGGLCEGSCDVAIVRRSVEDAQFDSVIVGLEKRMIAFAADDAQWSRRRQLTMSEVADRPILMDPRTGTTNMQLWAGVDHQPQFIESFDVDEWLNTIAAGHGVGTTAEATAHHHARPGVVFRPIKDSPRIPVRLAWWRENPPGGLTELVDAVTKLYAAARN
ncbi:hypothetical protein F8O05_09680 [Gulosibacter chungangensis]|uniref:LysR substrate-binding domain-containing protein n=2 Tax=Gulosibacter chungangensis TaxID=979746 RepID=A0A7J5BA93_9MICO|nr:hypothetical protein F8O05_09680 [Gulosibacter chungangensis]